MFGSSCYQTKHVTNEALCADSVHKMLALLLFVIDDCVSGHWCTQHTVWWHPHLIQAQVNVYAILNHGEDIMNIFGLLSAMIKLQYDTC